ncbi:MAG: tetratricopeptide repeat protein [Bryobacteraceae bacterium]
MLQAGADSKARAAALRTLAAARPANLDLWRSLAELELLNKNYVGAVAAYRKALAIDKTSVAMWNQLGYAQAFGGDLNSSKASFEEYRRLAPDDANAVDSLGEVHFRSGRFEEAESYFLDAFNRNNALIGGGDLYRAAVSRLLMGDQNKANDHFRRYLDFRKKAGDPLTPVREAIWRFSTGGRKEALASLRANPHPASQFMLALYLLQMGDAASALELARRLPLPQMAATITALARPQVTTARDNPDLRGYSLLLNRKFSEAVPFWRQLYDRTPATSASEEQFFLAWALMESGQESAAAPLLETWPMPPAAPEPSLDGIVFPRVLFFKARAEAHAGRRAEAARYYKLFLQYSGDLSLAFDEESRARYALAGS